MSALAPMRRSAIVIELHEEFPRSWILTRSPDDHGGSVGLTAQGRRVFCEDGGYRLGDEEPLNVLAIEAIGTAMAMTEETGIMAVALPGELYAWIEKMEGERKSPKPAATAESTRPDQMEMWPGSASDGAE